MYDTPATTAPTTADLDRAVLSLASPWRDSLRNYLNELELNRQLAARRVLRPDAPRLGRPRKPDHELKRPRKS